MPDYVSSIQMKLAEGESQTVTSRVHATISTYSNTTESFRDDSTWWEQYIEFDPGISIEIIDLYNNYGIGLLVNNCNVESPGDKSWCFLGIAPSGKDDPLINDTFQYPALEFNTRQDLCEGKWTVTKDTVELAEGHCHTATRKLLRTSALVSTSTTCQPCLNSSGRSLRNATRQNGFIPRSRQRWRQCIGLA